MKIIKGDLIKLALSGEFDVIVHGANCFNTMGSGIAKQIRETFPRAYDSDCATIAGDKSKLGTYSFADHICDSGHRITIVNAYTQYKFGYDGKDLFEYEAFNTLLGRLYVIDYCLKEEKLRWGFPLIGCGLAGGDKDRILGMIENKLKEMDVTIVEFDKGV